MKSEGRNKYEVTFDEIPELEQVEAIHPRGGLTAGEREAFDTLASFAMPIRALELVEGPKPVKTRIVLEVTGETTELTRIRRKSSRKSSGNRFHWFDLIALFSVAALALYHAAL
jgi:hypothetical protein